MMLLSGGATARIVDGEQPKWDMLCTYATSDLQNTFPDVQIYTHGAQVILIVLHGHEAFNSQCEYRRKKTLGHIAALYYCHPSAHHFHHRVAIAA